MEKSFEDLIIMAKCGDREAFDRIIENKRETLNALHRKIYRSVDTKEDAEDIFQNALTKAWKHIYSFKRNTQIDFIGWLETIARREIIRYFEKKEKNRKVIRIWTEGIKIPSGLRSTENNILEILEIKEILSKIISKDKIKYLRFVKRKKFEEIAAELSMNIEAARKRFYRNLKSLRKKYYSNKLR